MKKPLIALLIYFLTTLAIIAREEDKNTPYYFSKVIQNVEDADQTVININNITVWVREDGYHNWEVDGSWNGTFPKGTAGFIFSEGIVWGGLVNDGFIPELRFGGSMYRSGNVAGAILTDESGNVIGAENPEDSSVRPYRVRPDWITTDLTNDAANYFLVSVESVTEDDIQELRNQYEIDWNEWPAEKGAPYKEINGIPGYQSATWNESSLKWNSDGDIPGIPGADQTLWIVYNDLDTGKVANFSGSIPIGLEVQETYWAYSLDNPLGNTVFKRVRLIYKGTEDTPNNAEITDMYIAQWSDPDLGDYNDDFVGCDPSLSLGYVYNGSSSDAIYDARGLAPPAGGYDVLQGPMIYTGMSSDSTWFDFRWRHGYRNLPMTTFAFFAPLQRRQYPFGSSMWYNLLRGCEPRPSYPFCNPLLDENGNPTLFELSGDPVLGIGDLDGQPTPENPSRYPPGERRMILSSGPFNMALRDTQEVVIALMGALGNNYLQSVAMLKYNDTFAQEAYNNNFDLPGAPPAPDLRIIELDQELILEWESNENAVATTEKSNIKGYKFEGYNVYQLRRATTTKEDKDDIIRIATFDLETSPGYIFQQVFLPDIGLPAILPVQFGVNSGIKRYLRIKTDALNDTLPLINGKTYYFAVTAYNANMSENVSTHTFESPISQSLRSAIPHAPDPQTIYPYMIGDTVDVINKVGQNDGPVYPVIIDPESPSGQEFEIRYSVVEDKTTWNLVRVDVSPEDTLISQSSNLTGTREYRYLNQGGFVLFVGGVKLGIKSVKEGEANVLGKSNPSGEYYVYGTLSNFSTTSTDEDDYEIRFTREGSWALTGTTLDSIHWVKVPFEVWDLGSTESDWDDLQVFAFFSDAARDSVWNTAENDEVDGLPVFDKVHISNVEYTENMDDVSLIDKGKIFFSKQFRPVDNIYFVDLAGTDKGPSTGTTIRFSTFKLIRDGDVKSFNVGNVERSAEGDTTKKRLKKITVFPNPYLGLNKWEKSRSQRFVTFSHLPLKAIIRIYNLSGVWVRTIEKDPATNPTQYVRWDLTNEYGLPVASGIYIVHIEMPDIGEETVLKLAIIQERQYLRNY